MRISSARGTAVCAAMFVVLTFAAACFATATHVARDAVAGEAVASHEVAAQSCVDPEAGTATEEITLQCRLVDPRTGLGVSGVRVVASLVTYPGPPAANGRRAMKKTVIADRVSAESGSFAVDVDLGAFETSRCLITAWSKDWAGYHDFVIEDVQGDGEWDTSLDVPVYPRIGLVRLRTVNSAGESVPGCIVLVLPAWGDWQTMHAWYDWPVIECAELVSALGLLATSGPSGEITIGRVPVCEADPHAGYYASAFDQRHASRREWFEEPVLEYGEIPVAEIPVELIAALWLEGIVLDEAQISIPGASIYVNGVLVTETGADGTWRVEGSDLGAGPWAISMRASGYKELNLMFPRPEYLLADEVRALRHVMEAEPR